MHSASHSVFISVEADEQRRGWMEDICENKYELATILQEQSKQKRAAIFLTCICTDAYELFQTMEFLQEEDGADIDSGPAPLRWRDERKVWEIRYESPSVEEWRTDQPIYRRRPINCAFVQIQYIQRHDHKRSNHDWCQRRRYAAEDVTEHEAWSEYRHLSGQRSSNSAAKVNVDWWGHTDVNRLDDSSAQRRRVPGAAGDNGMTARWTIADATTVAEDMNQRDGMPSTQGLYEMQQEPFCSRLQGVWPLRFMTTSVQKVRTEVVMDRSGHGPKWWYKDRSGHGPIWSWTDLVMDRSGHGPIWSWTEVVQ